VEREWWIGAGGDMERPDEGDLAGALVLQSLCADHAAAVAAQTGALSPPVARAASGFAVGMAQPAPPAAVAAAAGGAGGACPVDPGSATG
jgi:hypothetical protein